MAICILPDGFYFAYLLLTLIIVSSATLGAWYANAPSRSMAFIFIASIVAFFITAVMFPITLTYLNACTAVLQ